MYVPAWLTAQLGPLPPRPLTQPAPLAPFQVPPAPVMPPRLPFQAPSAAIPAPPVAPPQYFSYPPSGWRTMPNYYLAPAQPYLIRYPLGPWPPYQQHYVGLHSHV